MIGYFLNKYQITVKNVPVMHNYVNVSIIMYATDTTLFGSVGLVITKAHVKFWFNPISSFCEKVEQTEKQKNKENYDIDYRPHYSHWSEQKVAIAFSAKRIAEKNPHKF